MIAAPTMHEVMQFGGRRPPGLIRRPNARGGNPSKSELATLEDYLARNLFSWMRADSRVEAAGKVTAFVDKVLLPASGGLAGNARSIDPAHSFSQSAGALQVAAIATSALLNGREVAVFTSAQFYKSTLALANWAFPSSGAGSYIYAALVPTSALANQFLWATEGPSGAGLYLATTATPTLRVGKVAYGDVYMGAGAGTAINTPTYLAVRSKAGATPENSLYLKNSLISSGPNLVAPGATPIDALNIGSTGGSFKGSFLLGDLLVANQDSPAVDAAVRRYLFLRYGLS